MEIFWTILTALVIFVFSQFILKFIFEPIVNYRKVVGKIIGEIKFYSYVILNPPNDSDLIQDTSNNSFFSTSLEIRFKLPDKYIDARKILRRLASDLEASYNIINCKSKYTFKLVINKKEKDEIVENLIHLSNITGVKSPENISLPLDAAKKIDRINEILKTTKK